MRGLPLAAVTFVACASATPEPSLPPAPKPVASASAAPKPIPTTLLPGVGMSTAKPVVDQDDDAVFGPAPPCAKDDDCWSRTCCPARAPEECVHASRARKCAIVDVSCKPSPMHYTCVCDAGSCKGRLAPP